MDMLSQISLDNLLYFVDGLRIEAYRRVDKTKRASQGQFFTSPQVASLMASFFARFPDVITLLDPGAGVGILSAAYVVNVANMSENKPQQISVTAYETEAQFLPYLDQTLTWCGELCRRSDISYDFEIIQKDFIQASADALAPTLFDGIRTRRYNTVILNPPYKKIPSSGRTKKALEKIHAHTTNLYTAFLWMAAKQLEDQGEVVSITPRSFCNGPYFLAFRRDFLSDMTIKHFHVFDERDSAFDQDEVLQENVIMHAVKHGSRDMIQITANGGPGKDVSTHEVAYSDLVSLDDPDQVIHIVTNGHDERLRHYIGRLNTSLRDLGIEVSTGKVVDFRAKDYLAEPDTPEAMPLIYPVHFVNGFIQWPIQEYKKPTALKYQPGVEKLLVPRGHYVLVKRFSAKEEKRRITAAVYDPRTMHHKYVGFENHLNYYHSKENALSSQLAKGLAAYLNSTVVDTYFRQFSGHTQVNATDLRNLKYPDIETLLRIGKRIDQKFPAQNQIDAIVAEELGVVGQMDSLNAKNRVTEALDILRSLGVPRDQQNERSALTLLALVDVQPSTAWSEATASLRGITEMMDYFREHYGVNYAPNTRETVRRYTIHQFWQMGLIVANPDDLDRPVNSPNFRYQVEQDFLDLVRCYGTDKWTISLEKYRQNNPLLAKLKPRNRKMRMILIGTP